MKNKVFPIGSGPATPAVDVAPNNELEDAKHQAVLTALKQVDQLVPRARSEPVKISYDVTRRNRVALLLTPEWSPHMPPYNLARMLSLARASGYESRAFDINAACYSQFDHSFWGGYQAWKWVHAAYWTDIHPFIENIYHDYITQIVEFAPTIVGVSVYDTSNQSTNWLVERLRELLPNAVFMAGGPQATKGLITRPDLFDHIVAGEGEIIFLDLLDRYEHGKSLPEKFLFHDKNIKIDLDSLPYPDYTDFNLDFYNNRGVSAEMSRGCVAKCEFCSETTFWRYRGRSATNILDEIEYQYRTHGINSVWFIDSLVNGNLRELRSFAQGIQQRGINIRWFGYARCDARVDRDFIEDLRLSGCHMLSFGVESGSQNVLNLMRKAVKRDAIEQNMKDFTAAGMQVHTNWFVGFPGETVADIAETMTLLWRTRECNITNRSTGTCQIGTDTPLYLEHERFGIAPMDQRLSHHWYTQDLKNTIVHRLIRYKTTNILLNHLLKNRSVDYGVPQERPSIEDGRHYTLEYDAANINNDIDFEDFDFDIIELNVHPVVDSAANEIWALLRVLWLAVGAFRLDLRFDPSIDMPEFGDYNCPQHGDSFEARYHFDIDANGAWQADFEWKYQLTWQPFQEPITWSGPWQQSGQWTRPALPTT